MDERNFNSIKKKIEDRQYKLIEQMDSALTDYLKTVESINITNIQAEKLSVLCGRYVVDEEIFENELNSGCFGLTVATRKWQFRIYIKREGSKFSGEVDFYSHLYENMYEFYDSSNDLYRDVINYEDFDIVKEFSNIVTNSFSEKLDEIMFNLNTLKILHEELLKYSVDDLKRMSAEEIDRIFKSELGISLEW